MFPAFGAALRTASLKLEGGQSRTSMHYRLSNENVWPKNWKGWSHNLGGRPSLIDDCVSECLCCFCCTQHLKESETEKILFSNISYLKQFTPLHPLPCLETIAFWFGSAVTCCKRHLKGVSHLWGESKLTPTGQQRLPEGETLLPQTTNLPLSHGGTFHCQLSLIASLYSSPPPAGPPFRSVAAR